MSRTDVHRPWPVQVADRYNRHRFYRFAAHPDHVELVPVKNFGCGCWMCTGQPFRKLAYRQERTWWRNQRHRIIATAQAAPEDRDTIDVPPFRPAA